MGKEHASVEEMFRSVMEFMRDKHTAKIDKAYEFFWDDRKPEEFLSGQAYAIGFHNFEDWFVFDSVDKETGTSILDLYQQENTQLSEEQKNTIAVMKESYLSVYEVASVAKDKRVLLKDLMRETDAELRDKELTRGLKSGDLFGARLLTLDGRTEMSGSVYPILPEQKKRVMVYLKGEFSKYVRNVNPDGTMLQFLKRYGDLINLTWIDLIVNPDVKQG